jgi:hypothetical protein
MREYPDYWHENQREAAAQPDHQEVICKCGHVEEKKEYIHYPTYICQECAREGCWDDLDDMDE